MSESVVCSVLLGPASDPLQRQDRLLRRNSQVCAPLLLGSARDRAIVECSLCRNMTNSPPPAR